MTVTVSRRPCHKTLLYINEPGCWIQGSGGDLVPRVHAPAGYGAGAALNITALVAGTGSQGKTTGAQE
jgi:hypothetical protein